MTDDQPLPSPRRPRRRWVRAALIVLLVIAAPPVAGLVWLVWRGSLAPNPTVDYTGPWNAAAAAVPEGDRAFPLYARASALAALPETLEDPSDPNRVIPFDADITPGDPDWAAHAAWVSTPEVQHALAVFREAADKPALGRPYGPEFDRIWGEHHPEYEAPATFQPPLVQFLPISELRPTRHLTRALVIDARRRAAMGNPAVTVEDIQTLLRVGSHLVPEPEPLLSLLGIAIHDRALRLADDHLELILADSSATRAILGSLDAQVLNVPLPTMAREVAGDLDLLQRVYTAEGVMTSRGVRLLVALGDSSKMDAWHSTLAGSDPDRWVPFLDTAVVPRARAFADLALTEQRLRDIEAARDSLRDAPPWTWEPSGTLDRLFALQAPNRIQGRRIVPSLSAFSDPTRTLFAAHALRVRAAILAHILTRGTPEPRSLPLDPYTGEPVRTATRPDGTTVYYSVGVDRNDDQARPAAKAHPYLTADEAAGLERSDAENYDGDWILWPIEHAPAPTDAATAGRSP